MATLGDLGLLLLGRTSGLSKVRALCALSRRHHAAGERAEAEQSARDAEAAARDDEGNRDRSLGHVAEAWHLLGNADDVQRVCDDAAAAAAALEGRDRAYAWCALADLYHTLGRSLDTYDAVDKAAQTARALAGLERVEILVDAAEQLVRARSRSRAEELVREIEAEAASMTGKDRAVALGLLAGVHFDLDNTLAARTAVDEAVAGAASCAILDRIILLTGAVETYISLGDKSRARDVLQSAQRDLLASEEAENEVLQLCIARGYGELADLPPVFDLARPLSDIGRLRVLSSVASIMHGKHKDDAAATRLIVASFDAASTLTGRLRQRAIDRLAPLCLDLDALPLDDGAYERCAEIARRLAE